MYGEVMVVVKLQQFTECESKGYYVRCCDATERLEIMSLYWDTHDTPELEVCALCNCK